MHISVSKEMDKTSFVQIFICKTNILLCMTLIILPSFTDKSEKCSC